MALLVDVFGVAIKEIDTGLTDHLGDAAQGQRNRLAHLLHRLTFGGLYVRGGNNRKGGERRTNGRKKLGLHMYFCLI